VTAEQPGVSAGAGLRAGTTTEPEYLVDLLCGERPVGRSYRAEHLGVELDLLKRDQIMDPEVDVTTHAPTSSAE
jgi:hypothetical protein